MTQNNLLYVYDDFGNKIPINQNQYDEWENCVLDYQDAIKEHSSNNDQENFNSSFEELKDFLEDNQDIKKVLKLLSTTDDQKLKPDLRKVNFSRLLTLARQRKLSNREIDNSHA